MSLEEAARAELLRMRKHRDGVTVSALSRTDAIRQVLGGGDSRVAYNALKHILLEHADDLGVAAASYSLGYASDGVTHLDRLTEFGLDHGYDQRQARRYSDRGIVAVARQIGSEWVLQASPVLRLSLVRWDAEAMEAILQTERLQFVEMRQPKVELVDKHGDRTEVSCTWEERFSTTDPIRALSYLRAFDTCRSGEPSALSVLWAGEIWPKFEVATSDDGPPLLHVTRLRVETLGARVQIHAG